MKKTWLAGACLTLLCAGAYAETQQEAAPVAESTSVQGRADAIEQIGRVAFKQELEASKARKVLLISASRFGWEAIKDEAGKIVFQYNKGNGKHIVSIEISYDKAGYQIRYVDSVNLNYQRVKGVEYIHPNYNRWIRNLVKEIGIQSSVADL